MNIWIAIESVFGNLAAALYRRGHGRIARPFDLLSWAAYDHCPDGYKGKAS